MCVRGVLVRGVWSAGSRNVGRGVVLPGASLGLPLTPGRLPEVLNGNSWDQSQVRAGCKAQVEFGCHAAEINHLACLDAGVLYPDA